MPLSPPWGYHALRRRAILKSRCYLGRSPTRTSSASCSPASPWSSVLLVAAAIVGIRNIQSIQENANNLVREQSLTNQLIDELHSQQTTLSEVFSVLARDPDSVDYDKIMSQLDEADRDIARISERGRRAPPSTTSGSGSTARRCEFSREARRLLASTIPETFSSIDLFRFHGSFPSVVARLLEAEYRKLNAAQAQIERRTSRLRDNLADLRGRQRAAGADLRHGHGRDGVATDSPAGIADRRIGPRLLAHAGGPGGHRAPLLPRTARRIRAIADRR